MNKPSVSIIGLGRVGSALLKVLFEKGYEVVSVYNRSEIPVQVKQEFPNCSFHSGLPTDDHKLGELVFITVSDDGIASIKAQLAKETQLIKDRMIVHCSGTHSSTVLNPLKSKGAIIASFHPMQAITKTTNSFQGTWFDMDGDEEVLSLLEKLAEEFHAKTFRVEPEAKPLLHASAVVASNYLVVLADIVSRISAEARVPEKTALSALAPLMRNTIDNLEELGVTDALTGPIAREDVETIREHLKSLETNPDIISLYKILGREAVNIAERKNGTSQSLDSIKKLLS